MFVFKKIPDVRVAVEITAPGEAEASTITARWRLHTVTEARDLLDSQREGNLSDEELIKNDLLSLDGISDESGQAIPFTPQLVDQLLDVAYVRTPLISSWLATQNGRAEYAAKN